MALIQSVWAKDQLPIYRPQTAGAVHAQKFFVDLDTLSFAANDILELAMLPPFAELVDFQLVPVGSLGAATVDVGLMSGQPGELTNDDGSARTVGTQLFAAAELTAILGPQKPDALLIKSIEGERSIGVKFSAAVAAGAGKKFGLILWFVQP
jgi:hypothetical protein